MLYNETNYDYYISLFVNRKKEIIKYMYKSETRIYLEQHKGKCFRPPSKIQLVMVEVPCIQQRINTMQCSLGPPLSLVDFVFNSATDQVQVCGLL